mmetsp:Transcript_24526/g.66179  ORF Transcript_24526/g.66179 Transcript_24526/m.66179 type:complete len:325 (+) Transcript_24526:91-1065(+)
MVSKAFHVLTPTAWLASDPEVRSASVVAAGEVLRGVQAYVERVFEPTSAPFDPTDRSTDSSTDGFDDGFHGVSVKDLYDLFRLNLALVLVLATTELILPIVGNLWPRYVNFLVSRRYYAGNWPGSVWLVHRKAWAKMNARVKTASPSIGDQLKMLYHEGPVEGAIARLMGFRCMHLQSRIVPGAMELAIQHVRQISQNSPKAAPKGSGLGPGASINDYVYLDGEFVAAWALGYNFGCGYLHGRYTLGAIQELVSFERGECLQITWESTPLGGGEVEWWLRDASDVWGAQSTIASGVEPLDAIIAQNPHEYVLNGSNGKLKGKTA